MYLDAEQSIRDVYLVFMSLGPESINCHNHPNTKNTKRAKPLPTCDILNTLEKFDFSVP